MARAIPPQLTSAQIPSPVRKVLEALQAAGHEAYLVGGCVRDLVSGGTPKDYDVATNAQPPEVLKLFRRVIPTGIAHGTVTVVESKMHVEVTTFRTEGAYHDARRPSAVSFHHDIEEDLSRRDFTFNAMAFDPIAPEFCDPFDGEADLARRIVRCVRDPMERFSEDGLRALRAVRFATMLDCTLEPATDAAISKTLHVFRRVAMERVREELTKIVLSPRAEKGLGLLLRTGLLSAVLPEAAAVEPARLAEAFSALARSQALEVRLAVLCAALEQTHHPRPWPLQPIGAEQTLAALMRLKYPNKVCELTRTLVRHLGLADAPAPSDKDLRRFAASLTAVNVPLLGELIRAVAKASPVAQRNLARLEQLLAEKPPLSARELALDGREIMQTLQVGPSAIVGEATRFLLDLVFENPSLNAPESLRQKLRNWASERAEKLST